MKNNLIFKLIVLYSFNAIVAGYSNYICSTIDTLTIGKWCGEEALATVGVSSTVFMLTILFVSVITNAGSTILSLDYGKSDFNSLNIHFNSYIRLGFIYSVVLTFIAYPFSGYIAKALTAYDIEIFMMCQNYIKGVVICFVPYVMLHLLITFTRIDGSISLGIIAILFMTISKFLLNYLLLGVMGHGLWAASSSSAISYTIGALFCLLHFRKPLTVRNLKFNLIGSLHPRQLSQVLKVGMPSVGEYIATALKLIVINTILLEFAGIVYVAIWTVIYTISRLTICLIKGVGAASIPFFGLFYAQNDMYNLRKTYFSTFKIMLFVNIAVNIFIFIKADWVCSIFNILHEVDANPILAVRIFTISMLFTQITIFFRYYYQSIIKTNYSVYFVVAPTFLVFVPLTLFLYYLLGINGVWYSFIASEVITILIFGIYIGIKTGNYPHRLKDFILLPENKYSFFEFNDSINNKKEEFYTLITDIHKFCELHDVKELPRNIINKFINEVYKISINNDNSNKIIDVKLRIINDSITLSIMDNCKKYNPTQYIGMLKEKTSNVCPIDIHYKNIMGINNMHLTILHFEETMNN